MDDDNRIVRIDKDGSKTFIPKSVLPELNLGNDRIARRLVLWLFGFHVVTLACQLFALAIVAEGAKYATEIAGTVMFQQLIQLDWSQAIQIWIKHLFGG